MVESQPSKLLVAGSIPVSRYLYFPEGLAPLGLPHAVARRGPKTPPPLRRGARFARAGGAFGSRGRVGT